MYTTLLIEKKNQIATLTINRPDKMNALNRTVLDELDSAIDELIGDESIRSVIITGAGPKAFVAGADISEFKGLSKKEAMAMAEKGQRIFRKIEEAAKPIVAAVNGFALGGGCELAMSCHFRIASEQAKFGQPEVNLGLIPGYGGTQRLVQLIGKGRAIELLISANMINATDAKACGLVNQVTSADDLLTETKKILSVINTKAPLAIASCIRAANAVFDETINGYELEVNQFGECFGTEDMNEGVSAFLEKRKAAFKGK